MNKQEKIIAALLGLALVGWLWYSTSEQKKAASAHEGPRVRLAESDPANAATNGAPAAVNAPSIAAANGQAARSTDANASNQNLGPSRAEAKTPERLVTLRMLRSPYRFPPTARP